MNAQSGQAQKPGSRISRKSYRRVRHSVQPKRKSTTSTFHYANQPIASESTVEQAATEGGASASYAEGFNLTNDNDDALTAVTMDSALHRADKDKGKAELSLAMLEALQYLASLSNRGRAEASNPGDEVYHAGGIR